MSKKKIFILAAILVTGLLVLAGCAGPAGPVGPAGPAGPVGPAGPAGAAGANPSAADLTCTQCHNDTTLIDGPETSWSTSVHATGMAFDHAATNAGCTACHTGSGFSDRMAAGVTDPSQFSMAYSNPTRIDCRACHNIHTTYTKDDFSLTSTDPVALYAISGATFDGGKGDLCANCHQPRATVGTPDADGMVEVTSTHWGPHHGPQAAMLLGVGGAGDVTGSPSPHYSVVTDTCVACHMGGDAASHTFNPDVAYCQSCHPSSTDFDMNGAVTALETKIEELKADLTTAGLLDDTGAIVVGTYPAAQANALWNYLYVGVEDKSDGVHNMPYAEALIDASLAAFK
jgi:ribosomal protein S27E